MSDSVAATRRGSRCGSDASWCGICMRARVPSRGARSLAARLVAVRATRATMASRDGMHGDAAAGRRTHAQARMSDGRGARRRSSHVRGRRRTTRRGANADAQRLLRADGRAPVARAPSVHRASHAHAPLVRRGGCARARTRTHVDRSSVDAGASIQCAAASAAGRLGTNGATPASVRGRSRGCIARAGIPAAVAATAAYPSL